MKITGNDWDEILKNELESPYFNQIGVFLASERGKGKIIYPEPKNYFKALKLCSYADTNVVILGQDPYSNPDEADGLAFSVSSDLVVRIPASLKAIHDAIEEDIYSGFIIQEEWSLERWAKQGILLLNRYLTVEKNKPNSHAFIGWEKFTNEIISSLSEKESPVVFILMGKKAQEVKKFINSKHLVLECEHPAAASYAKRKWNYNNVFSKCSNFLKGNGKERIEW